METGINIWVALYLCALTKLVVGFLNIEEINSVNYGIDILNKPVLSGQVPSGSVMYLKSRFGQQYQCSLPELSFISDESRLTDDPTVTSAEVDIAELLRPLEEAPCLVKMKDWWTYEFCYGKSIRQYHIEDNRVSSPEIVLGYYESEYNWKNDSKHDESSRNRLQRYHSQYYVNGTQCDVTGKLRRAEVRFLCEEGSGNYIAQVDEPESCRYVLTVHTSHVCHHPYLRPPPSNSPQPVTCNPVLTTEQFEEYLIQEEETKKAAEEQRWKWLAQQEERLEQLKKKTAEETGEDDDTSDATVGSTNENDLNDSLEVAQTESVQQKNQGKTEIPSGSESGTSTSEGNPAITEGTQQTDDYTSTESGRDERVQVAGIKESAHRSIEDQFTDLLDEAEEELNQNLANMKDPGDSFSQLASTLNKLIKKLDRAEQDINQASKTLEKFQQKIDTQSSVEKEDSDELVKVRVTRSNNQRMKVLQEKDVDETQRQQLEQTIRQKLEQSGLDTTGRKIEVKIITAEYPGNDDDKDVHVLSDEESQQFQHLIITFLAGNQEAAEQIERQQRMEENYRFVWGQGRRAARNEEEE